MTIVVYGAGGIGCYVGGRLAATGTPVTFVGRKRMADEVASYGLRLTDYLGADLLMAVPMHRFPAILRLPDFLFRRLAGKMLAIDPLARTSMWEDLEAGRPTEIDYLNGEVVRLAASLNRPAPVNQMLVTLIREAESTRRAWSGTALLRACLVMRDQSSRMMVG